uniref:Uncharacterized protein n=1 Tax=viral metagenome TaxID=1070528 RepID=A0A6C0D6H4_9ZZZZ
MSLFTANSIIERLEETVEELKAENEALKQRMVAMTSQLSENRKTNKKVLDQRDWQIASINKQLSDINTAYDELCRERNTVCESLKTTNNKLNHIIDARDDEISDLKEEFQKSYDDVITHRNAEAASLKKQLDEQTEFTEKAIAHANDTESDLFMKNAELTARVAMMNEMYERQGMIMYKMQMEAQHTQSEVATELANQNAKHLITQQELSSTKTQLDRAKQMLTAISSATSHITYVLASGW